MAGQFQLRVYCYLDRTQPQYASFVGTVTQGDLIVEGMASLYLEVAPGNEVFSMVDVAVKATEARPGAQIVEREFGMFEIHSHSQEAVLQAGGWCYSGGLKNRPDQTPGGLGCNYQRRPYQASCSTASGAGRCWWRGNVAGIGGRPAAYINIAANEKTG
jgi:hypothetical protein